MLPLWSSYLVKVYAWKLILAKEGILTWTAEHMGIGALWGRALDEQWFGGSSLSTSPVGTTEKVAAFDLDDAVEKYQAELAESAAKAAERQRKHDDKVKADADRRAKRAAEKAARDAEKA